MRRPYQSWVHIYITLLFLGRRMQVGFFVAVSTVVVQNFSHASFIPKNCEKKVAAGHGWDYGRLRKNRKYFKLQAIANSPQFLQTCRAFSCEQPAGLPLKLWIYTGSSSANPDSWPPHVTLNVWGWREMGHAPPCDVWKLRVQWLTAWWSNEISETCDNVSSVDADTIQIHLITWPIAKDAH